MAGEETPIAAMSFEAALADLEAVVTRLERSDVPLEESIALFARGAALRDHCEKKLEAAEARRNLEILMLHDPKSVDGIAIHMQILNTTRAKTRSRIMGQAFKLSEVLPRVKTPLTGIWGEFDSTTYPHIQERIDLFRALQPGFEMNVIPGAGHWVAYEAAEPFNEKLIDILRR